MTDKQRSIIYGLVCELANFLRQMGPVIMGIGAIFAPIWFLADDAVNGWLALPAEVTAIKERLGEVPSVPFVEFRQATHMWPEVVIPGQIVQVTYVLRWNRHCPSMTVNRRFQAVNSNTIDDRLTVQERATVASLTQEFELFTVKFVIPQAISEGLYAYRPLFRCNEDQVTAPATFFEVKAA